MKGLRVFFALFYRFFLGLRAARISLNHSLTIFIVTIVTERKAGAGMAQTRSLPLSKNQQVTLAITGLNGDGQGVGRAEGGYVVFVPGALPGEKVRVHIIKTTSRFAVGKLLERNTTHLGRVTPQCRYYDRCGGCQVMHLGYHHQLLWKEENVAGCLRQIGGFIDPVVHPVVPSEPLQYRNKAQFPVGAGPEGICTGLYEKHTHRVVDIEDCPIQRPELNRVLRAFRSWAARGYAPAYDETTGQGTLRHIVARCSCQGETMAVVVTRGTELPGKNALVEALREGCPSLVSVVQNIHPDPTNVVLGNENRLLWGQETLTDEIGSLRFEVSPHSFFQVNHPQMLKLYTVAAEYAGLTGSETVWDAYCGVGTIGQYLAGKAGRVLGVEENEAAVENAWESARRNGLANVEYIAGRAEIAMPRLAAEGRKPHVVLMDPPRKGCDPAFLYAAAGVGAERLVYISCNPATYARDAKLLGGLGYALVETQPVDLFPQTVGIECCGWFARTGEKGGQ